MDSEKLIRRRNGFDVSDYNFIRFFVILNETEKGRGTAGSPSGYCKVESLNGKAVFTVSIRNLQSHEDGYKLYILLKNSDMPVYAGEILPGQDGTVYKNFETKANDVFESGAEITMLEAMHVLTNSNVSVLYGYMNRNMTKQAQQYSNMKLQNIQRSNDESQKTVFEAASADINDTEIETTFPEEIESNTAPVETVNTEENVDNTETQLTESIDTIEVSAEQEEQSESQANSLSSYVQTLARLYEGIMGASGAKKHDDPDKPSETKSIEVAGETAQNGYWDAVSGYYGELFSNDANISPFTFSKGNSKWILVNPHDNAMNCSGQLIGLVYEDGNVKYIANGIPTYMNSFCVPNVTRNMIWLPTQKNKYGVTGYWLTFINAMTGKLAEPNINII